MADPVAYLALYGAPAHAPRGSHIGRPLQQLDAFLLTPSFTPLGHGALEVQSAYRAGGTVSAWVTQEGDPPTAREGAPEAAVAARLQRLLLEHPTARVISPDWRTQLPQLRTFLYECGGNPWLLTDSRPHAFDAALMPRGAVPAPETPAPVLVGAHPRTVAAVMVAMAIRSAGEGYWEGALRSGDPAAAVRLLAGEGGILLARRRDAVAVPIKPLGHWPQADWISVCLRLDDHAAVAAWMETPPDSWAERFAQADGVREQGVPFLTLDQWAPPLLEPIGRAEASASVRKEVASCLDAIQGRGGMEAFMEHVHVALRTASAMPRAATDPHGGWRRAPLAPQQWKAREAALERFGALDAAAPVEEWAAIDCAGDAGLRLARMDALANVHAADADPLAELQAFGELSWRRRDEVGTWHARTAARLGAIGAQDSALPDDLKGWLGERAASATHTDLLRQAAAGACRTLPGKGRDM